MDFNDLFGAAPDDDYADSDTFFISPSGWIDVIIQSYIGMRAQTMPRPER